MKSQYSESEPIKLLKSSYSILWCIIKSNIWWKFEDLREIYMTMRSGRDFRPYNLLLGAKGGGTSANVGCLLP